MGIHLEVQQDRDWLSVDEIETLVQLARYAGQRIPPLSSICAELGVRFVDAQMISSLHQQYFDDPSETDIITFPAAEIAEIDDYLGDIAICYPVAIQHANEHDQDPLSELEFLLLHGMLHIVGWDDQTDHDRQAMLAEQERILHEFETSLGLDS